MSLKKTLSIVIPAYNEAKIIGPCLDAIAAQTIVPFEVIVADNNSSDDTALIARSYPFVRVISVKSQGIIYARDAGFSAARGDIIARIDSDTILPSKWVERILGFYDSPEHAMTCITGAGVPHNITHARLVARCMKVFAFDINRAFFGHNILFGSNMAMPRQVWRSVSSATCTRTDIHEDLDLAVHVAHAGFGIHFDPGLKVAFRVARMTDDLPKHWKNSTLWWQTYRVHGYEVWPMVYALSLLFYVSAYPLTLIEHLSQRFQLQHEADWLPID